MTVSTWSLNRSIISNITNDDNGVVTTTTPHGLSTGQVVQLYSTPQSGMAFNFTQCTVTVIDDTNFFCNFSTKNLNPFIFLTFPPAFTPAQVIPQSGVNDNTLNTRG